MIIDCIWVPSQKGRVHSFRARTAEALKPMGLLGFPPKKGWFIFFVRALLRRKDLWFYIVFHPKKGGCLFSVRALLRLKKTMVL